MKLVLCQTGSQQRTDRSRIPSCQESTASKKVKRIQTIPVRGKSKLNGLLIENGKTKRRCNLRGGQPSPLQSLSPSPEQPDKDDSYPENKEAGMDNLDTCNPTVETNDDADPDNSDIDEDDSAAFDKIAMKQKRCEDLVKQELLNLVHGKKNLQSEFYTEPKRTNSKKNSA